MKTLQNNFTTPEQSKRLLGLGVPADSADMYYKHTMFRPFLFSKGVLFSAYSEVEDIVPCWSVGRLIEIIGICYGMEYIDFETLVWMKLELSEKLIIMINDFVLYNKIDFSKLEEDEKGNNN